MSYVVDPKKDASEGGGWCTAGRKVAAVVGIEMGFAAGKSKAEVSMVCVHDLENKGEESRMARDTLWLTEPAKWKMANFAKAARYEQPFAGDDANQLKKALGNRPVVITLTARQHEGKTYHDVDSVEEWTGEVKREWGAIADKGEKRYWEYLRRKEEKASQAQAGGGNDGGGYDRGSSEQPPPPDDPGPSDYQDDDVSF